VHHELGTSAVRMAELQYSISQYDERVFGMVMLLKHWAKNNGVAQNPMLAISGFSSFQLLMLIIHYLQERSIIPPLKYFLQTEEGTDSMDPFEKNNNETIEELVKGFFLYYVRFPFNFHGIDVYNSAVIQNNEHRRRSFAPNPLDRNKDVFANLSKRALEKFSQALEISCQYLNCRDLIHIILGSTSDSSPPSKNQKRGTNKVPTEKKKKKVLNMSKVSIEDEKKLGFVLTSIFDE